LFALSSFFAKLNLISIVAIAQIVAQTINN